MSEGLDALKPNDDERLADLCRKLGLAEGSLLREPALEALRHGSWLHEHREPGVTLRSNERLEFLGDAILGACVAQHLWQRFGESAEGQLTRLRASLVRAGTLAQVARSIGLGDLLLLGRGEERGGGRHKQNLLADCLEAVVAAVYLSQGLEGAARVVDCLLAPFFDELTTGELSRDYKTELQELLQAEYRQAPVYVLIDAPGPQHARTFEAEVQFQSRPLGRGQGRTKKDAEQAAAGVALGVMRAETQARAAALANADEGTHGGSLPAAQDPAAPAMACAPEDGS